MVLCIYVAFAVPFMVSWSIELCSENSLFWWEVLVDVAFSIDIMFQLRTRFENEDGEVDWGHSALLGFNRRADRRWCCGWVQQQASAPRAIELVEVQRWGPGVGSQTTKYVGCCLQFKRKGGEGQPWVREWHWRWSWFFIDVMSVVPSFAGYAAGTAACDRADVSDSSAKKLRLFKVLRLLRILKLLRIQKLKS
eukprot:COSAG01_NODE_12915_length_1664_cov_1.127796_3_plen_193_part_01